MKSYLTYVRREISSDDADSTIISTVLIFPILLMMLITMIEMPIFFSNRNLLQNDLRQGARTAAILGGNGKGEGGVANKLAQTYADVNACNTRVSLSNASGGSTEDVFIKQVKTADGHQVVAGDDMVACETAVGIVQNKGYIAFNIYDVKCGPDLTKKIGQATWCEAKYWYEGIPGGSMSLIGGWNHFGYSQADDVNNIRDDNAESTSKDANESGHGFNSGILRMSAQSEVCLASDCAA